jgi:hypothetical protein
MSAQRGGLWRGVAETKGRRPAGEELAAGSRNLICGWGAACRGRRARPAGAMVPELVGGVGEGAAASRGGAGGWE